jgi:hypothetical protein
VKKVVYTCVTDGIDDLLPPLTHRPEYEYVCFTDRPFKSKSWKMRPLLKKLDDPRRTARYHKTLGCNEIDADMTLWQDGKIQLSADPDRLFSQLNGSAVALFRHPKRDCAYREGVRVIHLRKSDPMLVKTQMRAYHEEGHPENWGLFETGVVARSRQAQKLNKLWWEQIEEFTERDQISLPFVLRKHSIDFTVFREPYDNDLFTRREHGFTDHLQELKIL